MSAILLHGYSAKNAGGALLVQQTSELLAEAGVSPRHQVPAAMDVPSFEGSSITRVVPVSAGLDAAQSLARRATAVTQGLAGHARWSPALKSEVDRADVVVAVGRGYMRARGVRGTSSLLRFHLPQLELAAATGCAVYLAAEHWSVPAAARSSSHARPCSLSRGHGA